MDVKEYLDSKPSIEEVAYMLCGIANHTLFNPP